MRIKGREEHNRVALTVIYFLGCIAVVATLMSGYLINQCIVYEDGLNAAAVALVGQMVSISTLSLGALGAMLSSTSPKPQPPPTLEDGSPAPTPVVGVPGGEPVAVEGADVDPEPEVTDAAVVTDQPRRRR